MRELAGKEICASSSKKYDSLLKEESATSGKKASKLA